MSQMLSVQEDTRKDTILEALSDRYSRIILETTRDMPKSAHEIGLECKVPISTIYRRLQELHDAKLVEVSGSISEDGKKFFMYKSKVREIATMFNGSAIQVSVTLN